MVVATVVIGPAVRITVIGLVLGLMVPAVAGSRLFAESASAVGGTKR